MSGFKTNRSNQQKTNCTCSILFLLISKTNLHLQDAFLSFPCRCFARLQPLRCFVRLKGQTSQLHITFMEELSYVPTQYFVSCVHVRFYFSLQLIFTLLAASISHFLTAALNFHVLLPTKFVSFISITCSSSFFVIHVSVDKKITPKKIRLCCCFFFLKVRAAM